jgi:hypothetical protein
MAQTIKLRRSSTSGAVPTTSSLSLGEVAINTYDGKMYIKKNDGSDAIVELSGDKLPLSGGTLTGTLNFGDNVRARFGASNDLQIYHTTTGNHSIIAESGSGNLILAADNLEINNAANNENKIVATSDGAVTLYFNNVSKFATQSYGALVSGVLLANDGSQSAPAFSFSNDSNTGMYRNSADILGFATGGARRGYFASSGIHSDSNVYSGTGGEFRNYAGTWRASTGVTGNGFTFVNSVDGTALTLTSTGAATFAGSVTSTGLTASGTLTQFNTYNSASTLLGINIVSDAGSTSYTHPYLDFRRWTGTGTNHYTASIEVAPTNADANAIVFMSDTKSTNTKATTERMRIDSSGNLRVGVGNTFEPVLQFTGSGRAQANPGFTFNGDLDTGMFNPSTQNTIAFATGGTEKMRITSAGFVGIGTTNPLDLLYIKSSNTDARLVLDAAAGADPELKFFEAGNVKHTVGYDAATSKFVIGTDNVDTGKRFTINSSGAITFNEAFTFPTADGSANQLLKTDGSGNMSWVTVAGVGNATIISDADNDTKIQVEESADEDKIRFDAAGVERFRIGSDIEVIAATDFNITGSNRRLNFTSGTGTVRTTGASNLNFGTSNTDRMTITSAGKVGIGTSSPDAKLSIHSSVGADPHTGDASLELRDTGALAVENGGSIIFSAVYTGTSGYIGSGPYIKAYKLNATDGDYSYGLKFATRENGVGAQVVGLTIAPDQNVGIGTTVPTSKLHIMTASNGASTVGTASDELILENSADCGLTIRSGSSDDGVISFADADDHNVGQVYYSHSNNSMTFRTNDSTAMTVTSAGNLGIGTTAAAQKLHVVGSAIIDGGTGVASTGVLNVRQSGDTLNNGIALTSSHGTSHRIWKDSAGKLNFGPTSLPSAFVQDLTGKVGIGTTAPNRKLHISGSGATVAVKVEATDGVQSSLDLKNSEGEFRLINDGGALSIYDQTDTAERFRIDTSGKVGIGTTVPYNKLHVNGTGRINSLMVGDASAANTPAVALHVKSSATNARIRIEDSDSSNDYWDFYVNQGDGLHFQEDGTNRVTFKTGGNVGIGTTSPTSQLHLHKDAGTAYLKQTNTANGQTLEIGNAYSLYTGANGAHSAIASDEVLAFATADAERMRIDISGRLLLNATSTAFGDKLYVNGDAYVTGGWRTGTGATFVGELTNSSGILTLQSAANRDIQLGDTNNPDIVYVDTSTENVGIGTTAPATTLHVTNSTTNAEVMRLTTTGDDPDRHMYFQSDHIYGSGNMYWGTGAYLNIFRASSHRFYYGTSNTEAMRVHTNGNISIGANTSPVYRLVVSNGNAAGIEFGPEYATDANLIQHYDRTASQYMDVNHIAQNHRFSRGASEWMRINSSGNVGIGTTSPTNTDYGSLNPKLHVKQSNTTGAFNLVARFEAGGDANETGGAILINHSNDRGMLIEGGRDGSGSAADDDAVGHLGILNSGGAHTRMITLRQNMVGASNVYNVGIGTTAPAAKLQVEELGIDTTTTSTAAVTQVAIDSMVAATFRSARYTIQVTNSTDSTYHLTEMLLIHDGTTPSISEFGTIFTGSAAEAAFTADINSGNVRILATPASTDAMAFKVVRHSITV